MSKCNWLLHNVFKENYFLGHSDYIQAFFPSSDLSQACSFFNL